MMISAQENTMIDIKWATSSQERTVVDQIVAA
jgi:hypothetical protein